MCLEAVRSWLAERVGDLTTARLVADDESVPVEMPLPLEERSQRDIAQVQRRLDAQLAREATPPAPAVRNGPLSYTAIALHDACRRRARYHYVLGLPDFSDEAPPEPPEGDHREPPRRDPARFGRVVHGALESVALARIAGTEVVLDQFVDRAIDEEGSAASETFRADALQAATVATDALRVLRPLVAEERFDVLIDGVALSGYIDLVARDEHGRLIIVDYKTGETPADHYAMQFSLYQRAVAARFPEPAEARLLRIRRDGASFEPVAPATETTLLAAIAAANSMDSDVPNPGLQCRSCPYAKEVCDAGRAFAAA